MRGGTSTGGTYTVASGATLAYLISHTITGTHSGTGAFNLDASNTGTSTLQNNGLIQVQTGTMTLVGASDVTGTYDAASGTTLTLFNGTHSFGDGAAFTGAGTVVLSTATAYNFNADVSAVNVNLTSAIINIAVGKTFTCRARAPGRRARLPARARCATPVP